MIRTAIAHLVLIAIGHNYTNMYLALLQLHTLLLVLIAARQFVDLI